MTRLSALAFVLLVAACGKATHRPTLVHARVKTNSLVLIDRNRNRVTGVVALGAPPTRLVYGDGAFWAAAPDGGAIFRVDAASHSAKRFRLGEEPYDVALGGGAVWVPDHDAQRVFRLDAKTGSTRATKTLGGPVVAAGFGLGAAWAVVAPGNLLRIDPKTMRVTRTTSDVAATTEGAEPKLLFTRDTLLVVSPSSAWIARIDANGTLKGKRNANGLTSGALAGTSLWLANSAGYVAPLSGRHTRVGYAPRDLAATPDAVWVAVYNQSTVKRVDPRSGRVVATLQLNRAPVAVAVGGNTVAVAVTTPL